MPVGLLLDRTQATGLATLGPEGVLSQWIEAHPRTVTFEPLVKAILEPYLGFEPVGEQLVVAGLAEPVVGRVVLG